MEQRAEVLALRDKWEHNEITSCDVWAYVNAERITKAEAFWILR